jgi:hypothetical protein
MPFETGNKLSPGRKRGSRSLQQKAWLRDLMINRLESRADTENRLDILIETDLPRYLDVLVKLMPKEQDIDLHQNRFHDWTDEELAHYAATGEEPQRD